ncbi:MAG: hypothetical protein ACRDBY_04665 [Cetobacterium sp.]
MDLNFIQGLAGNGEQTASSDNTMNYVAMKTLEGDITFTYDGDDRLEGVFKDYEKLGKLTQEQHTELLNTMNTCEWDLKVDFVNETFVKVEKYSAEEKAVILEERAIQESKSFYTSEKQLALAIEEDYRLGLEPITDEQMVSVKQYMKSIQPVSPNAPMVLVALPNVERPIIMAVYEERKQNGVL